MQAALTTRDLSKRYGSVEALKGVDLSVEQGELVGLLGPNGAGKSTLVKILVGLVRPSHGQATVVGSPAGSGWRGPRSGTWPSSSASPAGTPPKRCSSCTSGSRGRTAAPRSAHGCSSWSRSPTPATGASTGCRRGCSSVSGIAQALVGEPRVLLLDEPTSALDPVGRRTIRLLLEDLRSRGVSVLINSHLLSEIELVCDRVAILFDGELVAAGTPAELSRARGVELDTDEGVRMVEGATREDAPRLVAEAVAAGRRVYGVRVLASTLEDVYLEAVGGETD